MKQGLITTGKLVGGVLAALAVCLTFPLLIWVSVCIYCRHLIADWRTRRNLSTLGTTTCSIDSDCPSGYRCMDGKCIPALQAS